MTTSCECSSDRRRAPLSRGPVAYCDFSCLCLRSTACNVAVKSLAPTFGRLNPFYSKAMRLDWFNGTATCNSASL